MAETEVTLACVRCGQTGTPPQARRVGYPREFREKVLASVCQACWREWEGMEVKVINEYRLNFLDPQHRQMLQQACGEFLRLTS